MKVLIIPVAGQASRFQKGLRQPALKCLYTTGGIENCILYHQLSCADCFDKVIIVGGFLFDILSRVLEIEDFPNKDKIQLVKNEHYLEYGTMYSFSVGLKACQMYHPSEVVLMEGDLLFAPESFHKLDTVSGSAVTINREPIDASKAVVFYVGQKNKIRYLYDTTHELLEVPEPFRMIFNSAQIWKFHDWERLEQLHKNLTQQELAHTNLVLIQKYFDAFSFDEISCVCMRGWMNCNTVQDFKTGLSK